MISSAKIIELEEQHKTWEIYQKVKVVTGVDRRRAGNSFITNKEGRVLFDQQKSQDRREKKNIEELFVDDRKEIPQMNNTEGRYTQSRRQKSH